MYQLLFRSRWIALFWVVATMISVAAFVDEGGRLEQMESRAARGGAASGAALAADAAEGDDGFTPDAELVDDASGLEPSGEEEGNRRRDAKPADTFE